MTRALMACATTVALLAIVGCSAPVTPQPVQPVPSTPAPSAPVTSPMEGPGSTKSQTGVVAEMPDQAKLERINSRFPVEYPVAAGEVISRTVKPDGSQLAFDLSVAAPATDVAAWYRTTMQGRMFALTEERASDDGGAQLVFNRSGVIYTVTIVPTSDTVTAVGTVIDASK